MMKQKRNKAISLFLAMAMLFTINSMAVFAIDGDVCPNHQTHTEDCGYSEATPADCSHICPECKPQDSGPLSLTTFNQPKSPSMTYKELTCSISGAPSGLSTDIALETTDMPTESITIKGSSTNTHNLDEVLYTGKTITLTPTAHGYKFNPSFQEIPFDEYVSGTPLAFTCENDGSRELWITTTDDSSNSITNVHYTISAGETCEYYTTDTNTSSALILLYDAYYLNKWVTVTPSKEGYSFEPAFIKFSYGPSGNRYTHDIRAKQTADATKKDLVIVVTDEKTGETIPNFTVDLTTSPPWQGNSDSTGVCTISGLTAANFPNGTAELKITNTNYQFAPRTLTFANVGTITVSQNESINNNKRTNKIDVSAYPAEGGKVYGGGDIPQNELVRLLAVPNSEYKFSGWSNTPGSMPVATDTSHSFSSTASVTWYANFTEDSSAPKPDTVELTVAPNDPTGGVVTGTGSYPKDSIVILRAKANSGYKFLYWKESDKILSQNASYQITTTEAARTITAVFKDTTPPALDQYQITATANPAIGGTVLGSGTYASGIRITAIATPHPGYSFTNWTEDVSEVGKLQKYSFTVERDRTLTANFTKTTDPNPDPDPNPNPNPDPDPNPNPDPDPNPNPNPDPDPDPDPDPNPNPDPDPDKPYPDKPSTGGGSSNNSSGSTNAPLLKNSSSANSKKSTAPTLGNVATPAVVDENGKATVTVTNQAISTAIKKAQVDAKKNGTTKNGITVIVNVTTDKAPSSVHVNMTKKSIDRLTAAHVTEMKIQNSTVNVTLDLAALTEIQKTANSDILLITTKVDVKTLSKEAQAAIGNRPAFHHSLTGKNGVPISSFVNGKVSMSISYPLAQGEVASNLYTVCIDDTGKVNTLLPVVYDAEAQRVSFTANRFSVFGVGV